MKYIITLLILSFIFTPCIAQSDRGVEWNKTYMSDRDKLKCSRAFKITGLTLMGTGLYMASIKSNPQRLDVPIIIIGSFLTIEGIRLRKSINNRNPQYIFN